MNDHVERLTLSLPPERWETVPPPEGTVFLTLHRGEFEFFRPTISVEVSELLPGASPTDVAGVLLGKLRQMDADAQAQTDTSHPDRVLQRIRFTLHADGMPTLRLTQWQVIVLMPTDEPDVRLAMTIVMTAESERIDQYAADFQSFVGSASVTQDQAS